MIQASGVPRDQGREFEAIPYAVGVAGDLHLDIKHQRESRLGDRGATVFKGLGAWILPGRCECAQFEARI